MPIQALKVGSLGTHHLLGLAKAKMSRILSASTSEVYGDHSVHPQTEEYWGNVNPVRPRGVFDEAKRFQEAITMAYHTFQGLETRIVRIFNTYGLRMSLNGSRVLPAVWDKPFVVKILFYLVMVVRLGAFVMLMIWWKAFIGYC